jgi:hypothetical protein
MPRKPEPTGAKPPLPGLVKAQILWQTTLAGSRTYTAANVLHFRWSDNVNHTLANLNTEALNFYNHFSAEFLPLLSGVWEMTACVLTSLGGDGIQATSSGINAGGGGGNCLPPQCAACITWKAAIAWRGGRPRTYLPGIVQSSTTGTGPGQLTSVFANNLKTAAQTFIGLVNGDIIGGQTPILGMPSYYTKYTIRPTPLFFPFLDAVVHDRLDSQRRRTGKESSFPIG